MGYCKGNQSTHDSTKKTLIQSSILGIDSTSSIPLFLEPVLTSSLKLEGITVRDVNSGNEKNMDLSGLFIAIGHKPNTDIFINQLDLLDNGYLVTKPDSSLTNISGVFACGDVQDFTYRQAITAAGSGCMAAIDAERWLEEQGD